MKIIITTWSLLFSALSSFGQASFNDYPLIKANTVLADYRVGDAWYIGKWNISPHIKFDSLYITCHSKNESFGFYTDRDSIILKLSPGQEHKFYVSLYDTTYTLTVVKGVKPNYNSLRFDTSSKNPSLQFWYEHNRDNEYLNLLHSKYSIDGLIKDAESDTEKVLIILNWVHKQWQHNGSNEPQRNDAISILEEAGNGKNFRCVEYGIVATACLNAVGLTSRVLSLKTKDVETTQYGAGHVLLEVFLNDLKKWVLIDGQFDAMPVLNNVPLNAIEFQNAITQNYDELEIRSLSNISKQYYVGWIYPYLYYFDIFFDNREGIDISRNKINGKRSLMLVPLGAANPTIFQINYKIDNCIYTNSLVDFYRPPIMVDK